MSQGGTVVSSGGGGGGVTSVTGTANRITATPTTGDVVVDIASTYVGQTSITTLGTITTGTWNGSVIGPTFGGTGQSTYATGDMLYAPSANTLTKLSAGNTGSMLQYYNGLPTAASPSSRFWFYDDVMSSLWDANSNGSGSARTSVLDAAHPGCVRLECGTTTGTGVFLYNTKNDGGFNLLFVGAGVLTYECLVNIGSLCSVGQIAQMLFGLNNSIPIYTSNIYDNNITFLYDLNTSPNWLIATSDSGTNTTTATSVAVAANTWTKLKFIINASGTSVEFFIDNVSVGTISTNIPTGNLLARYINYLFAGTTNYDFYVDYTEINYFFTNPR